jgi:FolB domain-containing protein
MDEIFIKDLLVRGVIGITEREREQPQDILVNITVFADSRQAGMTDEITHSVNYRTIAKKTLAYVEQAKRFTVEALAADIMKLVLEEANVLGAKVRVEKPGAVRFSRSVGIEITRMKE